MSTHPESSSTALRPIGRGECGALFVIILIAATLRFGYPHRLAIEHFDEGVYASNIWFGDRPGGTYPSQELYAPPMLPAVIEWGFVFFGPSNLGAMWASQLAGTVTVALLWWLGRSWFGPVAGLTAASLCAVSEVHLLLSRSALTDALLGMWWVASLIALRRACETGKWSHGLLAGYLVGMAWYTKYNGWMPAGIVLGAVVSRAVICRSGWAQTRIALQGCVIAGVVAFATWSPLLWSLQSKGGYAAVMGNHRQYIVGLNGWWSSFLHQWTQLVETGWIYWPICLGVCYLALCSVAAWRAKVLGIDPDREFESVNPADVPQSVLHSILPYFTWRQTFLWVMLAFVFPSFSQLLFPIEAIVLWWLWAKYREGHKLGIRTDDLGYWIVVIWFAGLLVATPLYRPYLRLTLPWLLSTYCGIGLAFHLAWQSTCCELCSFNSFAFLSKWLLHRAVLVALFAGFGWWLMPTRIPMDATRPAQTLPLPDQRAFPAAAAQMAAAIQAATHSPDGTMIPAAVYVYAEPGLLFQLRNQGLLNVGPVGSLQFMKSDGSGPDKKVYLAIGVHARHDPQFLEQYAKFEARLKPLGNWPWPLSPLVALDQSSQQTPTPNASSLLELFEVQPP